MKKYAPVAVLFLLTPSIAELLSGSAPPSEFFNPGGFFVLCCLYGSGALIIRELTLLWGKGWPTMFVLGAAYGLIEEGLMVKSFFDPAWMDLGIFGSFGRFAGVNWVWSLELIVYHCVISIAIPITLANIIFPQRRAEPWLGWKGLLTFTGLLLMVVVLGYLFITPYRPPIVPYALAAAAVIGLVIISKNLPRTIQINREAVPKAPWWYFLMGFLMILGFYIIFWGLPPKAPVFIVIALGIFLVGFFAWVISRANTNGQYWDDKHRVALISGILGFFVFLSPIREFSTTSPDNPNGMLIVGIIASVSLVWLWRIVSRREKVPSVESSASLA
jgi:hypothetical protein